MARKASFGNTLARHGLNTEASLYLLLWTNPFCLSLQFSRRESTYSFFFQRHFFKRKKTMETLGLEEKMHKAKVKTMKSIGTNSNR